MSCEKCGVEFSTLKQQAMLYNRHQLRSALGMPVKMSLSCPYCLKSRGVWLSFGSMCKHIQKHHPGKASKLLFRSLEVKKQCSKCQRAFCNKCIVIQLGQYTYQSFLEPGDRSYICASCLVFASQPVCRNQIARLRISDLKSYSQQHNIDISDSIEKKEVVDKLMQHASLSAAVCNCRCTMQTNLPSFSPTVSSIDSQININSNNSRETLKEEMPFQPPNQQEEVNSSEENQNEKTLPNQQVEVNSSEEIDRSFGVEIAAEPVREEPVDLSTSLPAGAFSGIDVEPNPFEERTEEPHPSVFYFGAARSSGIERDFDAYEHVSNGASEHSDMNESEESLTDESENDAEYVPSGASGSASFVSEAARNFERLSKNLAANFFGFPYPGSAGEESSRGAADFYSEEFQAWCKFNDQPGPSWDRSADKDNA